MAAAEAKACCDALRRLREAAGQDGAAADSVAEILSTLEKLSGLQLDVALLRETGIGREVNDKFLRAHADTSVRERSRSLVHSWKSLVPAKAAAAPAQVSAATAASGDTAPAAGGESASAGAPPDADAKASGASSDVAAAQGEDPAASKGEEPSNPDGEEQEKPRKRASSSTQDDEGAQKKSRAGKKEKAPAPPPDGPNAALAALFAELSSFEFKRSQKWQGVAYKKVANTLLAHSKEVTSGPQAASLPNIGKASATKIQEYFDTGKIERLERYRNGDMED